MSKAISSRWQLYFLKVIPRDAPYNQVIESRRAFYAGAAAIMEALMASLTPGMVVTENDVHSIDEIHEELVAFAEEVKSGNA